jgi:tetratricopeptide (TPR) repeat protein
MEQVIRIVRVAIAALLIAFSAPLPAAADRFDDCFALADPETTIGRCSYLINRVEMYSPSAAAVHVTRGSAYEDMGEFDRALKDYRQAMVYYPPYALAYHYRSRLYIRMRQYERAIRDADTAIKYQAKDAIAHDMRALAKAAMGKADEARADAAAATALAGDNAYHNNTRCWTRAILNTDLDTARAACDLAIRTKADAARLDSRGFVFFRLGDLAKARTDYDAALSLMPNSASSLFMRGVLRRRVGETVAGDGDIAAALAVDPNVRNEYGLYGVTP